MENHFPDNLKYYRKLKHMSQSDLGLKLNISHQTVSTYEKGLRDCSLNTLIKLSEIFEISTDDLLMKDNSDDNSYEKILQKMINVQ